MLPKALVGTLVVVCVLIIQAQMQAQERGSLSGRATDSAGAVLQGAEVRLDHNIAPTVTDAQGEFKFTSLSPGGYRLTVSYVGFSEFSTTVTVVSAQISHVDAKLSVAAATQEVMVYGGRPQGEAEAINRERTSDNILQVLPFEVITSLPNTNVADALGRLPSVTLERDEGEGKYVQIRGTEPRLSNVTINGVNVASPESGVRQIKLDVIPADLVESVEISKTLSANQDGDAIGGSVNLVTKTPGEQPTIYLNGIGGYTPIVGGRTLSEFDGTIGRRFGSHKQLGLLFGGSYDWNGRGIDDIEPSPHAAECNSTACDDNLPGNTTTNFVTTYDGLDLREYRYYRTRYGFAGGVDYKLGDISGLYLHFLYSHFDNFGDRWVYGFGMDSLNGPTGDSGSGSVEFSSQIRRPVEVIGSLEGGGKHIFNKSWLAWDFSVSRSSAEDHGYASAKFSGFDGIPFSIDTKNPLRPNFVPQGGFSTIYQPALYSLNNIDVSRSYGPQLNLQGSASMARNYHLGSHFSTFEFGGKVRNAHKFEDARDFVFNSNDNPAMTTFLGSFTNSNYYDKSYTFGPTTDFNKIHSYLNANPGLFTPDDAADAQNTFPNNYDIIERISAGYLMNSIDIGRVRVQTGLRFEGTNESLLGYRVFFDADGNLCGPGSTDPTCLNISNPIVPLHRDFSYLDVLPSVQIRYGLPHDAAIRAAYGRGIARPDFGDLPPTFNAQGNGNEVDIGNPDLKPTRANNFDLLYEQYLKPLGLLQAGVFYKDIAAPIFFQRTPITAQFGQQNPQYTNYIGEDLVQPTNGSSAHLVGFEIAYQQHLTFLPGPMSGLGISANYSYTESRIGSVPLRDDHPPLQRQAPNSWNVSPTYDRGRVSVRVGISHNDANIFEYQLQDLNPDGTPNPVPLGKKGPNGDTYLYAHTQVDAQGSFRVRRGLQVIASGLNLTNEVFGFYNGSPHNVLQREYYKPSYSFGLRYTFSNEPK